jgi:bifunctional non-homologous end joining protein LigD
MGSLDPGHPFDQVLSAASFITRMARTREPALSTFDMRRARRRGKILIDVHRNHRGSTLISPYSVREHSGATISMPLEWSELEHAVYPEDFHLKNARERLSQKGDLLGEFFNHPQALAPVLDAMRSRRARPMV